MNNQKHIEKKELLERFDYFQSFLLNHFTDEEIFIIEIDFPDCQHHTLLHSEIRNKFVGVKRNMENNFEDESELELDELKNKLLDFMNSYIKHIHEKDMLFKKYYQSLNK